MPKRHFDPEKLFEINHLSCFHTHDPGCGSESDRRNSYHYTLNEEQAEVDMGCTNWFDVRELPMYDKYDGRHWDAAERDEKPEALANHHRPAVPMGLDYVELS